MNIHGPKKRFSFFVKLEIKQFVVTLPPKIDGRTRYGRFRFCSRPGVAKRGKEMEKSWLIAVWGRRELCFVLTSLVGASVDDPMHEFNTFLAAFITVLSMHVAAVHDHSCIPHVLARESFAWENARVNRWFMQNSGPQGRIRKVLPVVFIADHVRLGG